MNLKFEDLIDGNIQEMIDWYYKRTKIHIDKVSKFCKLIYNTNPDMFEGLLERGKNHDNTKYKNPELEPYIYLTWKYKCEKDGIDFKLSKKIEDEIHNATKHHVNNNRHHPEFHCNKINGTVNKDDRLAPVKNIIDATDMSLLDMAEMCADWMAVSEEVNNCPIDWARKTIGVRWKFDDLQTKFIYETLDKIWIKRN